MRDDFFNDSSDEDRQDSFGDEPKIDSPNAENEDEKERIEFDMQKTDPIPSSDFDPFEDDFMLGKKRRFSKTPPSPPRAAATPIQSDETEPTNGENEEEETIFSDLADKYSTAENATEEEAENREDEEEETFFSDLADKSPAAENASGEGNEEKPAFAPYTRGDWSNITEVDEEATLDLADDDFSESAEEVFSGEEPVEEAEETLEAETQEEEIRKDAFKETFTADFEEAEDSPAVEIALSKEEADNPADGGKTTEEEPAAEAQEASMKEETEEEPIEEGSDEQEQEDKEHDHSVSSDLIRGHINTIILRALYDGDKYGYEIIAEIERKSHDQYTLKQPSLYSALKRLEKDGYVTSYWGGSVSGGRRKYFSLTDQGKEISERNQSEWEYSRTVIDSLISDKDFDFGSPAPASVDMRMLRKSVSRARGTGEEDDEFEYDGEDMPFEEIEPPQPEERKDEKLEAERAALEEERTKMEEAMNAREEMLRIREEAGARREQELLEREFALQAEQERRDREAEEQRQFLESEAERLKNLEEEQKRAAEEAERLRAEEAHERALEEEAKKAEEAARLEEEERIKQEAEELRQKEETEAEETRLRQEAEDAERQRAEAEEKAAFIQEHERNIAEAEEAARKEERERAIAALIAKREEEEKAHAFLVEIAKVRQSEQDRLRAEEERLKLEAEAEAQRQREEAEAEALRQEEEARKAEEERLKLEAEAEAQRQREEAEAEALRQEEEARKAELLREAIEDDEIGRSRSIAQDAQKSEQNERIISMEPFAKERAEIEERHQREIEELNRRHSLEMERTIKEVRQQDEEQFRSREFDLLETNMRHIVNNLGGDGMQSYPESAPSPAQPEESYTDQNSGDFRSALKRIYVSAKRGEEPTPPENYGQTYYDEYPPQAEQTAQPYPPQPQAAQIYPPVPPQPTPPSVDESARPQKSERREPEKREKARSARSVDGIDFYDLEERARQDGILITLAGGSKTKELSVKSDSLVNKGRALFLSALMVFLLCVAEGSLALGLRLKFHLPIFYSFFIWGAGLALLLVTALLFINRYGERALRQTGNLIVNVIVSYALIVIVILIYALATQIDFTSINDLMTYIIFPAIFFLNIIVFGVVYYLQIRPNHDD